MDKKKGLVCIAVIGRSIDKVMKDMKEASQQGDIVELRLDGLEEIVLEKLLPFTNCPLIVTNRRKDEGGLFTGTEEERISYLEKACEYGATYVDAEWATHEKLRHKLMECRGKTKVILSYHDPKETPPLDKLLSLWNEMSAAEPDVVKIVPYAHTIWDSLTVLNFLREVGKAGKGKKVISHSMGKEGKITRLLSPMLGSILTYASLKGAGKTAPGQMTADQMRSVWKALEL